LPVDDFQLRYDPDVWLQVPSQFPNDEDATVADWAVRQAANQRARGFRETVDSGTLESYFTALAAVARHAGDHGSFWAVIAEDAPALVALTLDVTDAVGILDDLLSTLAGPTVSQYEPAHHATIHATGLGEGLQVTRLDVDTKGHVYQSQFFVFRHEQLDYVLSTQNYDIASLAWAEPKIQEFIDGITPTVQP
jgi:hypothetical protein